MKNKKSSKRKITEDNIFDFFIGFLFLPVILFLTGFSLRIFAYALTDYNIQEGEAILATSICAGIWILLQNIKILEKPRKTKGFPLGIVVFLII